jgi:acyl carrier protein
MRCGRGFGGVAATDVGGLMSAATDAREDRVRQLVCEHLEISQDELTESGSFVNDYGVDSLTLIDLLGALEKESGVVIDQDQAQRLESLESVRLVMSELAGW